MAATKAELEAAFEAGRDYSESIPDGIASVPDFDTWYANFAHERRLQRKLDKEVKKARALALVAECRRRSNINLTEADRPAPPYTKD
jgi:hypothetical protein